MSRDELDDFAAKLFEAARSEQPPRAAVERAVTAAAEARRTRPAAAFPGRQLAKWSIGLALAAGVALALWRLSPSPPSGLAIVAEPPSAVVPKPRAPVAEPAPSADQRASAPFTTRAPAPRAPAPSVSTPLPATLGDELDALKRAETALRAGDAAGALAALDRYEHVLKGSKLRAEAALLRMDALQRSGHAEQAAQLAQRFVSENPGSPLVDRARSFLPPAAPP